MRGPGGMNVQMMSPMTPMVKRLIIANVSVFLVLQVIVENVIFNTQAFTLNLALVPRSVIESFSVWQIFTYMFLHALGIAHITFNMLFLWWFGAELEQRWGSKPFLLYYFGCGVGAAIIYIMGMIIANLFSGTPTVGWNAPVIGASGAIFGILLAYGIIFGERVILFFGVFPMKAKIFVLIIGLIEITMLLLSGTGGSKVANLAHIGGLITGFIYLSLWTRRQQKNWRKKKFDTKRNLKLVINNQKDDSDDDGPRYWN